MSKEKNLELERLVFFTDAVVAIAITLLALDLRLDKTDRGTLGFSDLGRLWPKFSAFFLSFVLVAVYWKIHHKFYMYIRKMDVRLLWYNIFWLFFIIILPFSTTLLSSYFAETVSVFFYAMNTLFITLFQNQIWDYVAVRPEFLNEKATGEIINDFRFDCNVAMVNGMLASCLAFLSPVAALLILFARPLMINVLKKLYRRKNSGDATRQ